MQGFQVLALSEVCGGSMCLTPPFPMNGEMDAHRPNFRLMTLLVIRDGELDMSNERKD